MNIISTKKLLISLIVVMGIMMLGITIPEVYAGIRENSVYVTLYAGETSERFVPTGSDDSYGSSNINKILLHQISGSTVLVENIKGSYSEGTTSFLDGRIKVTTYKPNKIHGFTVKLSENAIDAGDEYRIEVQYQYVYPSGKLSTYVRDYNITIKEPYTGKINYYESESNYKIRRILGTDLVDKETGKIKLRGAISGKTDFVWMGTDGKTYTPNENIDLKDTTLTLYGVWQQTETNLTGLNIKDDFGNINVNEEKNFSITANYTEAMKDAKIYSNKECTQLIDSNKYIINPKNTNSTDGKIWYTFKALNSGTYYLKLPHNDHPDYIWLYKFNVTGGSTTPPPAGDIIEDPTEGLDNVGAINTENMEEINKIGSAKEKTAIYDKNGNVIGNIESGTQITVLGKTSDGKYYKIKWKETDVYAHQNWVDASNKKAIKTNSSYGPNIRTSAGSGTVLGDLVDGQPFTSVENGSGKYKKVSFEIEGYVKIGAIDVDESSVNSPDTETENPGTNGNTTGNSLLDVLLGTVRTGISLGMQLFSGFTSGEGTGGLLQTLAGTLTGIMSGGAKQEGTNTGSSFLRNGLNFMTTLGKGMNKIGEIIGTRIEDSSGNTLREAVSGAFIFVNLIDVLTSNVGG